jgi:hypothetical protein
LSKVARVGLVPHSNQALVASPFGFTVPFKVEEVAAIADAADVATVGGGGAVEESPPPPPHPYIATARSKIGIHAKELRYRFIFLPPEILSCPFNPN